MSDFEQVLVWLRALSAPCAPPIGVGAFEILYASAAEVVVWYSPTREGHRPGEVVVSTPRLAAAWEALAGGTPLDEEALIRFGGNAATGRWLLAILALLPEARVQPQPLTITWAKRRRAREKPAVPRVPVTRRRAPVH